MLGALLHPASVVMAQDGGSAPVTVRADGGPASPLVGTRWRWVRFTGPDGKQLVPSQPASYWIELLPAGNLVVNADCNRGHGRWSETGKEIKLKPLATTLMACPPGSLDSRFLELLDQAASYQLRSTVLVLTLQAGDGFAEGGTMRFTRAPATPTRVPPPPPK